MGLGFGFANLAARGGRLQGFRYLIQADERRRSKRESAGRIDLYIPPRGPASAPIEALNLTLTLTLALTLALALTLTKAGQCILFAKEAGAVQWVAGADGMGF